MENQLGGAAAEGVRPSRSDVISSLRELVHYAHLIPRFAARDIRVRYKQTLLGVGWAILQPLSLMLVFTLVFGSLSPVPTHGMPYPIFAYSTLVFWTFFSTATMEGTLSIMANAALVRKDCHATFVKALSWYFAFCNRVLINVQIAAINRYAKLCPLCVSSYCVCERTQRLPRRESYYAGNREEEIVNAANQILQGQKISRGTLNFDLNWFSNVFSDIYPVNRARWRVNRFYFPAKVLR